MHEQRGHTLPPLIEHLIVLQGAEDGDNQPKHVAKSSELGESNTLTLP